MHAVSLLHTLFCVIVYVWYFGLAYAEHVQHMFSQRKLNITTYTCEASMQYALGVRSVCSSVHLMPTSVFITP